MNCIVYLAYTFCLHFLLAIFQLMFPYIYLLCFICFHFKSGWIDAFFLLIVVYLTMLKFNYLNVSSEQVQLSELMNAPFLFVFN